MWVLSWKNYALSKMATFLSVIGTLVRYGGVLCLFSAVIPAGIICILIGVGFHFLAEYIGFEKWKKSVQSGGYEQEIREGNLNIAVQLYNKNPGKKTLKYFELLNPQVASQIKQELNNK